MGESGEKQRRQWGRKDSGSMGSNFTSPTLVTEKGMSGEARRIGGVTALDEFQRAFKFTQGEKGEPAPDSIHLTPSPVRSDDYVLGEFLHWCEAT